ncbi:MAG: hypothetical protein F4151_03985 [Gammaproteobacteria bacterium]|nr:hypothetical protein [Gammaproteobacteria bacterium]
MIRIQGPKGPVELRIHAFLNGQRTEPRTKDREIAEAIEQLDRCGSWHWLRHAALWQAPELLSEDEQLAVVLTEIGDPDHPQHCGVACIQEALGADGILRARDALARQGRLRRETWAYWTRRAGQEPTTAGANNVQFYEPFQWERVLEDTTDERCYVQLDDDQEVWVGKP